MWLIFLIVMLVVAVAALGVIWIGSIVYLSIRRRIKRYEVEEEAYESTINEINSAFEKKKKEKKDER